MLTDALKKIQDEINKNTNNPNVQVVGRFLIDYISSNPEDAPKVLLKGKSIMNSIEAMRKVAVKRLVGNCGVLPDEEGFSIVKKYYGFTKKKKRSQAASKQMELFDVTLDDLLKEIGE